MDTWRAVLASAVAMLLVSCGAASREAACFSVKAPRGVYQGVGTGATAAMAKASAQADLCRAIRVEVSTRLQIIERSGSTGGGAGETNEYSRVLQQVDAQEAACVFEGMPVKATTTGDDGALCVVLQLAERDYQKYLFEHRTALEWNLGPDLPAEALRGAVFARVRRAGFVPVEGVAGAPFSTRVDVSVIVEDSGVESMKVARGRLELTTRSADQRVAWHEAGHEVVARGFDGRRLLAALADNLAAALNHGAAKGSR